MYVIRLKNCAFFARHGVLDEEEALGQRFYVDAVLSVEPGRALVDDDADTRVTAVSSLYRTPPWGKLDQPDFLNAAAELSTRLSPRALLDLCLDAERKLKRVREERWGPRLIDIDILVFGDRIIHE